MKSRINWKRAFILACILFVVIVAFYQTTLNIDSTRINDLIKTIDKLESLNSRLLEKLGYTTITY